MKELKLVRTILLAIAVILAICSIMFYFLPFVDLYGSSGYGSEYKITGFEFAFDFKRKFVANDGTGFGIFFCLILLFLILIIDLIMLVGMHLYEFDGNKGVLYTNVCLCIMCFIIPIVLLQSVHTTGYDNGSEYFELGSGAHLVSIFMIVSLIINLFNTGYYLVLDVKNDKDN